MKARLPSLAAAWLTLIAPVPAQLLVGYGLFPYDPLCAESCLRSLTGYTLECTMPEMDHGDMMMMSSSTTPDCFASDTAFLTTVAWCFSTKCAEFNVPVSKLQLYWEKFVTGSITVPAKWTYPIALSKVTSPPTHVLNSSDTDLTVTSIVSPDLYLKQWNVLGMVARENAVESKYSIALFVTAVGLPLVLTWFGYLPFTTPLVDKLKPYIVYPSLIGKFQVRPLPFLLGNAPTVGQGIYIAIFVILSTVFAAVDYKSGQPNGWFGSQWQEISAYVLYRTGTLGFMLLPVLFLFASRNNVLLWLTNWSHSTYLLLHRWVARVFTLYVVIHSIIGLQIYAANSKEVWWIWGAVATVATALLAIGSGLYVRASQYEFFLISHILLSVFVVVGCWYHIIGWYASMAIYILDTWGYEIWVYFGIAVWFFDRLARVGRILRNGAPRSRVTDIGNGYVRVDIHGIRWGATPGQHAYVYFPTLDPLRPWENHPFSIIPTPSLPQPASSIRGDEEKQGGTVLVKTASDDRPSIGITLFIKKANGITKHLQSHEGLLTLLDGPYSNCSTEHVLRCDRILLIAGGIGITGLLPWTSQHWNSKLAWSVSESARCLTDAIDLSGVANKEVRVGRRFNVVDLIEAEAEAGWERVGVVVSGPGALCDDVRAAVAAAGRKGNTAFELEVDAYSW